MIVEHPDLSEESLSLLQVENFKNWYKIACALYAGCIVIKLILVKIFALHMIALHA